MSLQSTELFILKENFILPDNLRTFYPHSCEQQLYDFESPHIKAYVQSSIFLLFLLLLQSTIRRSPFLALFMTHSLPLSSHVCFDIYFASHGLFRNEDSINRRCFYFSLVSSDFWLDEKFLSSLLVHLYLNPPSFLKSFSNLHFSCLHSCRVLNP
jgi:hypothetical protein